MALVQLNPSLLGTLKDRVVVLTGGASGIGRAAVEQFHEAGAKVVFGDVQDSLGQELEARLGTDSVRYVHCDTSSYSDQLHLFQVAAHAFNSNGSSNNNNNNNHGGEGEGEGEGRIDIVVANAAIAIHKDPFLPDEDITIEPPTAEIDINLKGALFTARIGMHYLRKNNAPSSSSSSSSSQGTRGGDLVLVSSIAGFKESGGLATYTASKHGVIGLLRGLRVTATPENIRINVICPWMTKTRLVKGIEAGWYANNLPTNEPADVARAILICATANRAAALGENEPSHSGATLPFAGKILWIGGGQAYEIEDRLQALEPEWLGTENSRVLAKGQAFLASEGTSWDVDRVKRI